MPRIIKVVARGLWSHLDSVFEYSPDLTVTTGPNGVGKSVSMEIVNWISVGDREGESFLFEIRDPKTQKVIQSVKEGTGEIYLDNGVVMTKTRVRGGRTFYTHSSYPDPFIQSDVPDCIRQELGLKWYKFGDYEILLNFVSQHAGHFMLSEAPSVGAKILGILSGTEVIDSALKEFQKDQYSLRKIREGVKKDIQDKSKALFKYISLDNHRKQIDTCKGLMESVIMARGTVENLTQAYANYGKMVEKIVCCDKVLNGLVSVPSLQNSIKDLVQQSVLNLSLTDLQNKYNDTSLRINSLCKVLAGYAGLSDLSDRLVKVTRENGNLTPLVALHDVYQINQSKILTCVGVLETVQVSLSYAELVDETDSMISIRYKLQVLQNQYNGYQKTIDNANDLLQKVLQVDTFGKLLDTVKTKVDRRREFMPLGRLPLMEQYNVYNHHVTHFTDLVSELSNKIESCNGLLVTVPGSLARFTTLVGLLHDYNIMDQSIKNYNKVINDTGSLLNQYTVDLEGLWDEAGVCPWCGSSVGGHKHEHVR